FSGGGGSRQGHAARAGIRFADAGHGLGLGAVLQMAEGGHGVCGELDIACGEMEKASSGEPTAPACKRGFAMRWRLIGAPQHGVASERFESAVDAALLNISEVSRNLGDASPHAAIVQDAANDGIGGDPGASEVIVKDEIPLMPIDDDCEG